MAPLAALASLATPVDDGSCLIGVLVGALLGCVLSCFITIPEDGRLRCYGPTTLAILSVVFAAFICMQGSVIAGIFLFAFGITLTFVSGTSMQVAAWKFGLRSEPKGFGAMLTGFTLKDPGRPTRDSTTGAIAFTFVALGAITVVQGSLTSLWLAVAFVGLILSKTVDGGLKLTEIRPNSRLKTTWDLKRLKGFLVLVIVAVLPTILIGNLALTTMRVPMVSPVNGAPALNMFGLSSLLGLQIKASSPKSANDFGSGIQLESANSGQRTGSSLDVQNKSSGISSQDFTKYYGLAGLILGSLIGITLITRFLPGIGGLWARALTRIGKLFQQWSQNREARKLKLQEAQLEARAQRLADQAEDPLTFPSSITLASVVSSIQAIYAGVGIMSDPNHSLHEAFRLGTFAKLPRESLGIVFKFMEGSAFSLSEVSDDGVLTAVESLLTHVRQTVAADVLQTRMTSLKLTRAREVVQQQNLEKSNQAVV